jgi:uncharacterized protein YbjT (DUF2867 family)
MNKSVLLFGSTGLTGSECLKLILEDPYFSSVTTPVRRPIGINHQKLKEVILNFNELNKHPDIFSTDVVICSIGTTINKAKTKEEFRRIDFEIPLSIAKISAKAGIPHFLLVSSLGANFHSSVFYYKIKGLLEDELVKLPFKSITIVRPSVILGKRKDLRIKEEIVKKLIPFVPKKYKPVNASRIASAIIDSIKSPPHGIQILENSSLSKRNQGSTI